MDLILYKKTRRRRQKEKAESDTTFQAVKTDQYPIGYLMNLKRICF